MRREMNGTSRVDAVVIASHAHDLDYLDTFILESEMNGVDKSGIVSKGIKMIINQVVAVCWNHMRELVENVGIRS